MKLTVTDIPSDLSFKHRRLERDITRLDSLIVAYSGGVDSALVMKVAHDVLGDRVIAITADSPALPRVELSSARRLALDFGVRHVVIRTAELHSRNYAVNPSNRCYFCKSELYVKLIEVAAKEGIEFIANGTNYDDLQDYRPGLMAAEEYRVKSPLKDAHMTKADIRSLAKILGLPIW
ncbi:ATP-dependent sacrificial sulfur transferase LarE, partial [bacterium]|nr:ATP-dependent sacrificial sulfur transferase LarE [bacterium]